MHYCPFLWQLGPGVVVEVAPFEEEGEDLADIEWNIFSSTATLL